MSGKIDVERLARAMESIWPGWTEEAGGTKEAQREMRDYARSLIEEYDRLADSASPPSDPPMSPDSDVREACALDAFLEEVETLMEDNGATHIDLADLRAVAARVAK